MYDMTAQQAQFSIQYHYKDSTKTLENSYTR